MTHDELKEKFAEKLWQAESWRVRGRSRGVPWSEADENSQNSYRSLAREVIAEIMYAAAQEITVFSSWHYGDHQTAAAICARKIRVLGGLENDI